MSDAARGHPGWSCVWAMRCRILSWPSSLLRGGLGRRFRCVTPGGHRDFATNAEPAEEWLRNQTK